MRAWREIATLVAFSAAATVRAARAARGVTRRCQAAGVGDAAGWYRRAMGMSSGSRGPQINVTPLIDVLLVLLVIFLVVMPFMVKALPVEVPRVDAEALPATAPVVVKLRADATASIDDGAPIAAGELAAALRARLTGSPTVFVDFEDGVPWSDVIATVDTVQGLAPPNTASVAVRIHE